MGKIKTNGKRFELAAFFFLPCPSRFAVLVVTFISKFFVGWCIDVDLRRGKKKNNKTLR